MGKRIEFDFDALARDALTIIGDTLVKAAQGNMDKVSNGRTYIIKGKPHVASKIGDSPNNMSGELRGTIRYELQGKSMEYGSGDATVDYAKYLEAGKLNRPNITKTIVQCEDVITREVERVLVNSVRWR